ncbi:flippase [Alkalihalobacterium sp. APHAB7]|uniref:flippase n=1 Tax=Alkalihalobacterium sp. APHAB7 TaxID=3402081 RepID=UPI003AAFF491
MPDQKNLKRAYTKLLEGKGIETLLLRGASKSLFVQVVGTGLAFILQIFLARILGVQNFGDYVYVLTWLNILVLIGKLGYDTATLRYIPKYEVEKNWKGIKGFLIQSLKFVILSSSIVSIIMVFFISFNSVYFSSSLNKVFYIAALLIPPLSLLQLYRARLRSLKKVLSAQVPMLIIRPLILMVIVGVAYVFSKDNITASQVMGINLVAVIVALGISIWFFRRNLFTEIAFENPTFKTKEWLKVSIPLLFISGMQVLMENMDVIMLGSLINTTDAGIYSSAQRISTLVTFGLIAVNMMVAPMISELYYSGRIKDLQRIVTLASWGIFGVTSLISIVLVILGKWLLSFFGEVFTIAYLPLLILLVGNIINALCGSVGSILNMTGNQSISAKIVTSALIINFLLNLLLIPKWGISGAALATTVTVIYWNIFMTLVVIRKLSINPTIFRKRVIYRTDV